MELAHTKLSKIMEEEDIDFEESKDLNHEGPVDLFTPERSLRELTCEGDSEVKGDSIEQAELIGQKKLYLKN